jgi:hypothetical protein
MTAVLLAPAQERIGLQPDDLSSQHYVTSASGSMRDPRYISITPP